MELGNVKCSDVKCCVVESGKVPYRIVKMKLNDKELKIILTWGVFAFGEYDPKDEEVALYRKLGKAYRRAQYEIH